MEALVVAKRLGDGPSSSGLRPFFCSSLGKIGGVMKKL